MRGTLHWVSAAHAISAEVRLYDRLFKKPYPDEVSDDGDFISNLNPNSCEILSNCFLEPGLKRAKFNQHYQFERLGYFYLDSDSSADYIIFNQTVPLRDPWTKIEKAMRKGKDAI